METLETFSKCKQQQICALRGTESRLGANGGSVADDPSSKQTKAQEAKRVSVTLFHLYQVYINSRQIPEQHHEYQSVQSHQLSTVACFSKALGVRLPNRELLIYQRTLRGSRCKCHACNSSGIRKNDLRVFRELICLLSLLTAKHGGRERCCRRNTSRAQVLRRLPVKQCCPEANSSSLETGAHVGSSKNIYLHSHTLTLTQTLSLTHTHTVTPVCSHPRSPPTFAYTRAHAPLF